MNKADERTSLIQQQKAEPNGASFATTAGRVVAGALFIGLAVFALNAPAPEGGYTHFLAKFGEGASPEAGRLDASAAWAKANKEAETAKEAFETAKGVAVAADAEAQKLRDIAVNTRTKAINAGSDEAHVRELSIAGPAVAAKNNALEQTAKLTELETAYKSKKTEYDASTALIATLEAAQTSAEGAETAAQASADEAAAASEESATAASAASKEAEDAKTTAAADASVGEEDTEAADARTATVTEAAEKGKQAEIAAASASSAAADAKAKADLATLAKTNATKAVEEEKKRNGELATASNKAQQAYIKQANVEALARTAAADALAAAEGKAGNASLATASAQAEAEKAEAAAADAEATAEAKKAEADAAEKLYLTAKDTAKIASAELMEKQAGVEVADAQALADANAAALGPAASVSEKA